MSKRLAIAVLVALVLNLIATGYGAVAAAKEDRAELFTGWRSRSSS